MVATVHPEASKAGVAIMQQGGNAVDAAVAVGFALAVVYPEAGNIGGGGFMLFRRPDGEVHFLDYREKAPAKATANMYLDSQGNVIPDMSTIGYKAIAVPGSVAGLAYAQQHWGKLSLKQVMEPAIRLARDGFVLEYEQTQVLPRSRSGEVSRVAPHLPARRQLLSAGRSFQAAGAGEDAGAHRRQSGRLLPRRAGARTGRRASRRAEAWSPPTISRTTK